MAESSRRADGPLSRAQELARAALAHEPAGLLTDFDGTLSPIVSDPTAASLVAGAGPALERLARRLAVVAFITGRAPLDARGMVAVPGLLVVGNHGTEWLEPGAESPEPAPESDAIRRGLDAILVQVPEMPGVTVEHKGLSATVHYRNAPDPDAARDAVLAALGGAAERDIDLRHGRMSVELRPRNAGDKGVAARRVIERYGLRGAVVMGDDVTDLDMFAVVAEERERGTLDGVIIGVAGAGGETPPAVREAADVVLDDPEMAAQLLESLTQR